MSGKQSRFLMIAASLVAVFMLALAAGCITNETKAPVTTQETQTIKISGSTTVLPIIQKAADQYMATHAGADIQISGGGSWCRHPGNWRKDC